MNLWTKLGISACAILLLIIVITTLLRKQRKRELRRTAEDKLREEALDSVLTGRKKVEPDSPSMPSVPFDVKYDLDQRRKNPDIKRTQQQREPTMVQVTERSELSVKKYMFHVTDHFTFGKSPQNDIIIPGSRVSPRQCEVFRLDRELYVKNLNQAGQVILKRKKKTQPITTESIALKSNDVLVIGDYSYEIVIFKT